MIGKYTLVTAIICILILLGSAVYIKFFDKNKEKRKKRQSIIELSHDVNTLLILIHRLKNNPYSNKKNVNYLFLKVRRMKNEIKKLKEESKNEN